MPKTTPPFKSRGRRQEYMREWWAANKHRKKRYIRKREVPEPKKQVTIEWRYSGEEEPPVCSTFGCKNHLSPTTQLFGNKCIHCQKPKVKIDASRFVSYPIFKIA